MTAGTNLLLALLCFIFFTKCKAVSPQWKWFFLLMSISTFLGVLVHGLRDIFSNQSIFNTWMLMSLVSGTALFFAQLHTLKSIYVLATKERIWTRIISVQLLLFYVLMLWFGSYQVVKIHGTIAMLPIMAVHLLRPDFTGGKWISFGISLSIISAVVHSQKFSFSPWFNYNDIAHVVLMATFYFTFKGVMTGVASSKANANQHKPQ